MSVGASANIRTLIPPYQPPLTRSKLRQGHRNAIFTQIFFLRPSNKQIGFKCQEQRSTCKYDHTVIEHERSIGIKVSILLYIMLHRKNNMIHRRGEVVLLTLTACPEQIIHTAEHAPFISVFNESLTCSNQMYTLGYKFGAKLLSKTLKYGR